MEVKKLPWIEKYRPSSLDEMIDHGEKITTLRSLIANHSLTHLIFYGLAGTGKCHAKGTLMMLSDGHLKPVEDLKVGDLLMGDDSQPRTILSVCRGQDRMVNIDPNHGPSWQCNLSHVLCLKKRQEFSLEWDTTNNVFRVNWVDVSQKKFHTDLFRVSPCLKSPAYVDEETHMFMYPSHDLAFSAAQSFLEKKKKHLNSADEEAVLEISVEDYLKHSDRDKFQLYRIIPELPEKPTTIDPYLWGRGIASLQTQHPGILEMYLLNSKRIRLEVLYGVIDALAVCRENRYHIKHPCNMLIHDLVFLAHSLGYFVEQPGSNSCVIWRHGMNRLPCSTSLLSPNFLVDFKVEEAPCGDYYGFTLDGNGRYLLSDCMVTHNTSMILACAREMYGDQMGKYILELNASDDRGIETVRKKIVDFVKLSTNKIRLVILDEVDAMTTDAQSALRRVIEDYSEKSRFCLICNNINKIIPGLQSRCTKMRFGYLNAGDIMTKLKIIIEKEGVRITEPALERLIEINKDFRQILNTLQCLHAIRLNEGLDYRPLEPDEINEYLGIPTDQVLHDLIAILFGDSLSKTCAILLDLFKNNQWNLSDLLHKLAEYVIKNPKLPEKQKYFLIEKMSEIEVKLSQSNDAEIQLYALVSAFQQSKKLSFDVRPADADLTSKKV